MTNYVDGWRSVPFWSLYRREKTTGHPDEELLSVYRDYGVIRKSDRSDNWNRAGEDMSAYQLVEPGDLVLNKMKTWQGSLGVSPLRGIVSPAYFVYKPQTDDDPSFLHYTLRSMHHVAFYASISKGVRPNQWDLQPELLNSMRVLLPGIETQRDIAENLRRVDAMILVLEDLAERLKEHASARLSELGKRLVEPGPRVRLGLLLDKLARTPRPEDGVVTAFRDGQVALRSRRRQEGFTMSASESSYQAVEAGDFVFHGLDGFAGAVGVSEDRGIVSPAYHVCTATGLTSERFMAWAVRALSLNGFLESNSFSVRQRSVDFRSWDAFAGLSMAYIPLAEQHQIADDLDEINGRIDDMLLKISSLRELLIERSSALITQLSTGRKEVAR